MCGEMAGDPQATPLLLGLGLYEFSMAPTSIPMVKQVIRNLMLKKCREIARAALGLPSTETVKEYLNNLLSDRI
ncbi:putative PEP-binding protein [Chloroflexota bacterium]